MNGLLGLSQKVAFATRKGITNLHVHQLKRSHCWTNNITIKYSTWPAASSLRCTYIANQFRAPS